MKQKSPKKTQDQKKLGHVIAGLGILDQYIQGMAVRDFKRQIDPYLDNLEWALRKTPLSEIRCTRTKVLNNVLNHLSIPVSVQDSYLTSQSKFSKNANNMKVHDLLLLLSQEGSIQISYFLELIERKRKKKETMALVGGAGILASAGLILSALPETSYPFHCAEEFFKNVDNLPLIGLIKTTAMTAFWVYYILSDEKVSLKNRFRDLAFLLAKSTCNYVGYGLWMAEIASLTPVICGLFALCSFLDVLREVVCLVQESQQSKIRHQKLFLEGNNIELNRAYARHDLANDKHRNSLIINLLATLAVVAIIGVWTFVPGGILVILPCIAALASVNGLKSLAQHKNDKALRYRLQERLAYIEREGVLAPEPVIPQQPAPSEPAESMFSRALTFFGAGHRPLPRLEASRDLLKRKETLSVRALPAPSFG